YTIFIADNFIYPFKNFLITINMPITT
ncbi:MAG: hypothetical protein QOJ60_2990, partial [Actinomycetota bacterium]|nr:hypothetical protein [Actinomycetota bacterium]